MYLPVVLFEIACWVSFAALVGYFVIRSALDRRVHVGLWLAIGIFSMSWLEAPFDNAMFAQFHPDFHRLPAWGPIGATQGGLPVIAPPGYVMYFLAPALIAAAIAKWGVRRYGWRRGTALLTSGLVVGMAWDAVIETGQANLFHLWAFARTAPGLVVGTGTIGQVPVYVYLAMGLFIMAVTYLLGGTDAAGVPVLEALVARRVGPGSGRTVAKLIAYIVVANGVYALSYVPHVLTKASRMLTQAGVLVPFPGRIAIQPGADSPQTNGPLGAAILWVWLLGLTALIVVAARRADRLLGAAGQVPEPSFSSSEPVAGGSARGQ